MKYFEKQGIKWQNGEAPTWLVENYDFVFGEKGAVVSFDGDCLRMGGHGNKLIEVSDLMEESKMKDYVTISRDNLDHVRFIENNSGFAEHNKISNVRELRIPKSLLYPKARMSVAEEQELIRLHNDRLSKKPTDIRYLLNQIYNNKSFYPILWERMFGKDVPTTQKINKQRDVVSAYFDNSLIEVIPDKKFNVKVPISEENEYYHKNSAGKIGTVPFVEEDTLKQKSMQFTAEELKHYGLDNDLFEKVEVSE